MSNSDKESHETKDPDSNPESLVDNNDKVTTRDSEQADEWAAERPKEYGGRRGPDPVRYGDWEKNGRCIDF